MTHYFGFWLVSQLGFATIILGIVIGGIGGYAVFEGRVLAGCVAGAAIGALLFEILFRRWLKSRESELDQHHRESASNREQEFQRKLAEAKANGTLDRYRSD